jgi:hypothetical protein
MQLRDRVDCRILVFEASQDCNALVILVPKVALGQWVFCECARPLGHRANGAVFFEPLFCEYRSIDSRSETVEVFLERAKACLALLERFHHLIVLYFAPWVDSELIPVGSVDPNGEAPVHGGTVSVRSPGREIAVPYF